MNFFDHQARAKRDTRFLVFAFLLAVIGIVLVIDLLALYVMAFNQQQLFPSFSLDMITSNASLLAVTSLSVLALIGVASMYRSLSLRAGGGKVAVEMGGVRVSADDKDPLRRRLRNVVEEIALASGVPVPEIYILEQEEAINAFAAGFEPSSAAIGVTRGTLEKLNRDELQGVIAHEFSHILNGDMRLNIRLIGLLFGISVLALIGRSIVHSSRRSRFRSRSNSKNEVGIIAVALLVMIIGYIGVFVARLIKASVSRKREYLADASAVQFTRNPVGISGALKKIAIDSAPPELGVDTEEVSHMMFGATGLRGLFATHPSLTDRIQRVDRNFRPEHLKELSRRLAREQERKHRRKAAKELKEKKAASKGGGKPDFTNIVDQIGNPSENQILFAALVAASIPQELYDSAHSPQWSKEVICYTLLAEDADIRQKQLLIVAERMGTESLEQVDQLIKDTPKLDRQQRLPLAEMAFPSLKRRPPFELEEFRQTIHEIVMVDNHVDVFEYALAKMLDMHLGDAISPPATVLYGNDSLKKHMNHVAAVILVVAKLGNDDEAKAKKAMAAGMEIAGLKLPKDSVSVRDWQSVLDESLPRLEQLAPKAKEKLIMGLVETITADHEVTVEEAEILRIICASIRVPLPILPGADQMGIQ